MKIGPQYKIARRLGSRIFPKTQTTKFSISGSPVKGGRNAKRGGGRPKQLSEYGSQLLEKQKARFAYGLKEGQFSNYVKGIRRNKGAANPITQLYRSLELRLDNVVYRLGLSASRLGARQLVTHGHILVNGRRVNIPSYRTKAGEVIAIRPQSQALGAFKNLDERLKNYHAPEWVVFDALKKEGSVKGEPNFGGSELDINFGAILEFYSRV